jgi:hypothetical protein
MASFVQVPVFKINERLERSKIAAEEICEVFADFGHGNEVMGQQLSECAGRCVAASISFVLPPALTILLQEHRGV